MRESRPGSGPARGARPGARPGRDRVGRSGGPGVAAGPRAARVGPGRGPEVGRRAPVAAPTPSARTTAGAAVRGSSPEALRDAVRARSARPRRRPVGPSTARLAAVVVVLGLLLIAYASSVRAYLVQRSEIRAAEAGIALREHQVAASQRQVERWSDPLFLAVQARERYALVRPGDHLWSVVEPPAVASSLPPVPSVGGVRVTVARGTAWWSRVLGSVGAAAVAPAGSAAPVSGAATPGPASAAPVRGPASAAPGPGTATPGAPSAPGAGSPPPAAR